jgi:hypothetical protein
MHPGISLGRWPKLLTVADLPGHGHVTMTNNFARAFYRDYFIDLEQDAQGWRVIALTHSLKDSSLPPPAFYHADQAMAEQYARAAINVQTSTRRRR